MALSTAELHFAISEGCLGWLPGKHTFSLMLFLNPSQSASSVEQLVRSQLIDAINRNNLSKNVFWGKCLEINKNKMGCLSGVFFFWTQIFWYYTLDKQSSGPSPVRTQSTGCFQILYMPSVWKMLDRKGLKLHLQNSCSRDFIQLLVGWWDQAPPVITPLSFWGEKGVCT